MFKKFHAKNIADISSICTILTDNSLFQK